MSDAAHRARKRFGQHFLHDEHLLGRMVAAVRPRPDEHLVEIGPGLGALTAELLPEVGRLVAVELDRDVIPRLAARCAGLGELQIESADALKFDFRSLAPSGERLRVVGNLPYNISTPLLFHLLGQAEVIEDMHFLLQKEVVDRLAATPGGGDYGRLSVMMQYHCRVEPLFTVPPEAFTPPPQVDSAFVRLAPNRPPPVAVQSLDDLQTVVTRAFAHRRKTLRNNLKGLLDVAAIEAAGIDPVQRAETLGLGQFAALANTLTEQS